MNLPMPLGLVRGMPNEQYHAIRALSASGLKHLVRSPAHYFGMQLDPNRPAAPEPTAALRNGTLTHCALFEPDQLAARYVVRPADLDGRTKDGKAWLAAQTLEVVDADAMRAAQAQAAAVRQLPDVAALLAEGEPEVSALWLDEETVEHCKCRPDWTSPAGDGVILVDGKTTTDASPTGFAKAVWNWRYDLQAAWYSDGYEQATGKKVHGFVFAVVESAWPHCAGAYMLADDVLDAARRECRRLVRLYSQCMSSGHWPGYDKSIQQIQLPAWAMKEIEA